MALGQTADIEPCDVVGAGVEHAADETGVGRDHEPFRRQSHANAFVIGHGGKGPRIGAATAAAAGTAVVGALVGIVATGGAVAEHRHDP